MGRSLHRKGKNKRKLKWDESRHRILNAALACHAKVYLRARKSKVDVNPCYSSVMSCPLIKPELEEIKSKSMDTSDLRPPSRMQYKRKEKIEIR